MIIKQTPPMIVPTGAPPLPVLMNYFRTHIPFNHEVAIYAFFASFSKNKNPAERKITLSVLGGSDLMGKEIQHNLYL